LHPYIRFVEFLAPKPDLQYYLHVEPEVSFARKDDIPSITYLEERKKYYDNLSNHYGITTLDGNTASEVNCQNIINDLKKRKLL